MIIVLGSVLIKPELLAEALKYSEAHVARSRAESGCITHDVSQDTQNPHKLIFVERWADQSALHEHFKVPASQEFAKTIYASSVEPPSMLIYDAKQLNV